MNFKTYYLTLFAELQINVGGSTLLAGLFSQTDILGYTYGDSNRLKKVTDGGYANKGFIYGNSGNVRDYEYDQNGNLVADRNKGITKIEYNYLNLPLVITFTNNASAQPRRIEFIYDASGAKLRKTVFVNNVATSTRDYINGIEYLGGVLDRFAHTEGSVIRNAGGTYEHEYVLKDHLGNARVTYSDANNDGIVTVADIKQLNSYYPFGMNMDANVNGAAGSNKYQYNSKEWNDDFGLNWNDYGARFYDPAMARWNMVDPLSDKYYAHSGYNYVLNNPLLFTDPDGREVDVSKLLKTQEGFYQLVNTLLDLQNITGMNLEVVGGKLKEHNSTEGVEKIDGKSKGARDYTRALLNDKEDNIVLGDNQFKQSSLYAQTQSDHQTVGVEGAKIDNLTKSMTSAGLNPLTFGFGFNFLHESMHTKSGSKYFKNDNYFNHLYDNSFVFSKIEEQLNQYRKEMGLPQLVETESISPIQSATDFLRGGPRMTWILNGTTTRVLYQKTGESDAERLKRIIQFNTNYINNTKK